MSEISLTLVLQIKTSKIINGMAKVSKKSEKITAFGGIFFVLDKFDHILSSVTQLRSDTATQRHKVFPMCWDLVKVLYL